ncbi:alpha/beta hydrolase [Candidatus Latescibacterota bacterium]
MLYDTVHLKKQRRIFHMVVFIAFLVAVLFSLPSPVFSQISLDDIKTGALPDSIVYKKTGDYELKLYVFFPDGFSPGDKRTGIIWIHGGGWRGGNPQMFFSHCRYYAARGAVGISVQYRLVRDNGPTVSDCIRDCKSAMRFIRGHAQALGIEPSRIAVMGDSAGGHLAACMGVMEGFNDIGDDTSVSAAANAMVLYNPVVDLAIERWMPLFRPEGSSTVEELARSASPINFIGSDEPPCMILHGFSDTVVSAEQAIDFSRKMIESGNRCDLMLLGETGHAFVIPDYTAPEDTVVRAIRAGDEFLVSLGLLDGRPSLNVSK